MYNYENLQLEIFKNAKSFIFSFNKSKFLKKKNSIFFLASNFPKNIGFIILKKISLNYKFNLRDYIFIIKDIFYSSYYISSTTKLKLKTHFNKIVVSWAFKENFNKDGSYNDRYFNINSRKEKKVIWYLVYLDKELPNKIDKNIIIYKATNSGKLNLFNVILNICSKMNLFFKSPKYFLSSISSYNFLAEKISLDFKKFLNNDISHVLMPFEGQPFQNEVIRTTKNFNKKIKTVGYIHAPPLPVATHYIFKSFSPDRIIVNGADQLRYFVKFLGWKKNKIKVLKSDRFLKLKKLDYTRKIYLPISIVSKNLILRSLNFLINTKLYNLKGFKIQNHPGAKNSKVNIQLIKEIKNLIKKNNQSSAATKKKFSIFIGGSGAIIEALERNLDVIQICENPIFEMYSKKLWPNIKCKRITNYINKYSLKKSGSMIKLGLRPKNLNHYWK